MDFVVFSPQNEERMGEMKVVVWRSRGMFLWADVTSQPREDVTRFINEVAREHEAETSRLLGTRVRVEPRLVTEACLRCGPNPVGPPCRECLLTDEDEWSHLPGWWDLVDLPELRDEVILARSEGVRQGQAPRIIDLESVWAEGTRTRGTRR